MEDFNPMRGKFHFGCGPGVVFYHGRDGPIMVNKKNWPTIQQDMEKVLDEMEPKCGKELYKAAIANLKEEYGGT